MIDYCQIGNYCLITGFRNAIQGISQASYDASRRRFLNEMDCVEVEFSIRVYEIVAACIEHNMPSTSPFFQLKFNETSFQNTTFVQFQNKIIDREQKDRK